MNQRDKLAAEAIGYKKGHDDGFASGLMAGTSSGYDALQRGIRRGRNEAFNEMESVQWWRLFGVVVAGSVIGCGIVLALAVGLSQI